MELLQIKMLNTAVERILNQEMAEFGLTYTQTTVIGYLLENSDRDVCQKDIEYSLGLTHPTVSSILRRMEAVGIIRTETQAADRRYKKITLTEKAIRQREQIQLKYCKVKEKLFEGVSQQQRDITNATIQAMLKNAQR